MTSAGSAFVNPSWTAGLRNTRTGSSCPKFCISRRCDLNNQPWNSLRNRLSNAATLTENPHHLAQAQASVANQEITKLAGTAVAEPLFRS